MLAGQLELCNRWGGNACGTFRFIWCHSQVFQSSASWWFQRSHAQGLEIAESTSPDERCLKGGYQDWGTQSKHLTHMHTPALRVCGSDENWQWFVCNDYSCVCDPQLQGQLSSQTSCIHHWQHEPKDLTESQSKCFLCLNQDTGDTLPQQTNAEAPKMLHLQIVRGACRGKKKDVSNQRTKNMF